jgi:hypothetical protein
MHPPSHLWILPLALLCGCKAAVKVDVECPRLCLDQPGQPLPGFQRFLPKGWDAEVPSMGTLLPHIAATVDGGSALGHKLMSGIADAYPGVSVSVSPDGSSMAVDWAVELDFDEILDQVPSSTLNLAANVQISSLQLASTNDLTFLESAEVFIGRRAKSTRTTRTGDAGTPATSNCAAATSGLPIARYYRSGASLGAPALQMAMADGALNVFDCMSGAVTVFSLKMAIPADSYPATDTPLALGSCVSLDAHVSYP